MTHTFVLTPTRQGLGIGSSLPALCAARNYCLACVRANLCEEETDFRLECLHRDLRPFPCRLYFDGFDLFHEEVEERRIYTRDLEDFDKLAV